MFQIFLQFGLGWARIFICDMLHFIALIAEYTAPSPAPLLAYNIGWSHYRVSGVIGLKKIRGD